MYSCCGKSHTKNRKLNKFTLKPYCRHSHCGTHTVITHTGHTVNNIHCNYTHCGTTYTVDILPLFRTPQLEIVHRLDPITNIGVYILPSSFPQLEIVHRLDPFNSRRWEPLALGADYRIPKARSQPAIVKTTLPLSLLDDPEYVEESCVSIILYPLITVYTPL